MKIKTVTIELQDGEETKLINIPLTLIDERVLTSLEQSAIAADVLSAKENARAALVNSLQKA